MTLTVTDPDRDGAAGQDELRDHRLCRADVRGKTHDERGGGPLVGCRVHRDDHRTSRVGANGNSQTSTTPPSPSKMIDSQEGLSGGSWVPPNNPHGNNPWCGSDIKLRYEP